MTEELLVDGAELHVEVAGEGVPLVFVHGLGLQAALWNRLCDALGTGYQLVRVSLRGSPRSRELEQRELSLERWASDLGAVVDALELDRPVLVGHSLGGAVVLRHALDRPFAARALVLMCTEADLSNLAPRMLASAERIEREGLEPWLAGAWVGNPPFSAASLERDPDDARRVPRPAARERPRRLRPAVPRDRLRREPLASHRRGRPADARPRRLRGRPHAARARPCARGGARCARGWSSSTPDTRCPWRLPRR